MRIEIRSLIGETALTLEEGQKLYECVYPELKAGRPIELDFSGVNIFASPFFNFAIGQLLGDIAPNTLNRLLTILNLSEVGMDTLGRVIDNSKKYYASAEYQRAVDEVVAEELENS